jgi:hypothetical protein
MERCILDIEMSKLYLAVIIILFLMAVTSSYSYAESCLATRDNQIIIDGTPHPELINCPMEIKVAPPLHSETEVHVNNNNSKPDTIIKTEVITVVVTATPLPTPTIKAYQQYKSVMRVFSTPTPSLTPTATPSATMTPIPTKKPALKAVENNNNLFQSIIRFFKNIFHL